MTKSIFLFSYFLTALAYGQETKDLENFKIVFSKALDKTFSEKQLDKMFNDYSALLTPHSDITRLSESLEGHAIHYFLFTNLKMKNCTPTILLTF